MPPVAHRVQELREQHPDWLVQCTMSFARSCNGHFVDCYLAVSHRWQIDTEDRPDAGGSKLQQIVDYLGNHPLVEYIFVDYACVPHVAYTPGDAAERRALLSNWPIIFLGCTVLVLLDPQCARAPVVLPVRSPSTPPPRDYLSAAVRTPMWSRTPAPAPARRPQVHA